MTRMRTAFVKKSSTHDTDENGSRTKQRHHAWHATTRREDDETYGLQFPEIRTQPSLCRYPNGFTLMAHRDEAADRQLNPNASDLFLLQLYIIYVLILVLFYLIGPRMNEVIKSFSTAVPFRGQTSLISCVFP